MTAIPGTILSAKVTSGDTAATFPVADINEVSGGIHIAADNTARDAIPSDRRPTGCGCWVTGTSKLWFWNGSAWVEFVQGSGAGVTTEDVTDLIGAAVVSGDSYITTSFNDGTNTLTLTINTTNVDERIQDVVGAMATDSTTIDFTYSDPAGTLTAVVKPTSIDNTHVAAALITGQTAKTAMASDDYLLLYDTTATALKKLLWSNLRIAYDALPTRMLQTSAATPTSSTAALPMCFNSVDGFVYVMSSSTNNVNKVSLRTGLSTHVAVNVTGGALAQTYYSTTLDRVIVSGGTGFAVLNANTGVCGSLVAPTAWSGSLFFYDEANDLVYYGSGASTVIRRCTSSGGSAAASNVVSGGGLEYAVVVGSTIYVLDTSNDQVHKITTWPAIAASVSVGVAISANANRGFTYIPQSGKIWLGTDAGLIKVIDPATMTVVQTITLSGVNAVNQILVHPTTSKNIVYVCNGNKLYAVDAISGAILDFIVWTTGSPSSVAFDTNIAQLCVAYNGATAVQRCTS